MRHEHDECSLSEECRLTCHVRTRDDDNLLTLRVEVDIVRHILFAERQLSLYHRMPSLMDVDDVRGVDMRSYIVMNLCTFRKRKQTVDIGNHVGVYLNLRDKLLHGHDEVVKQFHLY